MKHVKEMTDDELLESAQRLVSNETEATLALIHHLQEIEFRRLYSGLKHPNLVTYAMKTLGYCKTSAWNRVAAMRVMKDIPEVEGYLRSGSLKLTGITKLEAFMRQEDQAGKP